MKDCNEGKFLFDNFVLRCGQITMQDVLRPEEKKDIVKILVKAACIYLK
jgi:hypothetical protein